MLEKIGIASLVILVATESFAFSEAVLWALAAFMHLGAASEKATFGVSALLGVAAGVWILRSALANREA
jgi:hypothetical protein